MGGGEAARISVFVKILFLNSLFDFRLSHVKIDSVPLKTNVKIKRKQL